MSKANSDIPEGDSINEQEQREDTKVETNSQGIVILLFAIN